MRTALVLTVVAVLVAVVALPDPDPSESIYVRLAAVLFAAAGFLATRSDAGRRMGALLLAIGLVGACFDLAASYAEARFAHAVWAAWASEWLSVGHTMLAFVFLPLMFPTGDTHGPRWKRVQRAAVVVTAIGVLAAAVSPSEYRTLKGELLIGTNPLGVAAMEDLLDVLFWLQLAAMLVLLILAVISLGLRFRRARGDERLQLRWLFSGVAGAVGLGVVAVLVAPATGEVAADAMFGVGTLLVPLAIAVALLRYRLYDLDRVVSRTVAYAVVTAVLAGVYAAGVLGVGALVPGESSDLVVAGSTLAVAALFQPVRRRVQAVVDRRFNRARYDAQQVVAGFAGRLRSEVDLHSLSDQLQETVDQVVQPGSVSLVLVGDSRSAV